MTRNNYTILNIDTPDEDEIIIPSVPAQDREQLNEGVEPKTK